MQQRIRQARLQDIHEVGRLFNDYRMFYNQKEDLDGACQYIEERMERQESVILVAELVMDREDGTSDSSTNTCTGFVQLYSSFSSVSMGPIWVLNDLYVHSDYRQQGIARMLLKKAKQLASEQGILRISLSTGRTNKQAQSLYESEGYAEDTNFMYYDLNI